MSNRLDNTLKFCNKAELLSLKKGYLFWPFAL